MEHLTERALKREPPRYTTKTFDHVQPTEGKKKREREFRCGAGMGLKIWYFREEKMPQFWWGVIRYKAYHPVSRELDRRKTRNLVTFRKHPILNACRISLSRTQTGEDVVVYPRCSKCRRQSLNFTQMDLRTKRFRLAFFIRFTISQGSIVQIIGSLGGDEATFCPQFYMSKSHDYRRDSPALKIARPSSHHVPIAFGSQGGREPRPIAEAS